MARKKKCLYQLVCTRVCVLAATRRTISDKRDRCVRYHVQRLGACKNSKILTRCKRNARSHGIENNSGVTSARLHNSLSLLDLRIDRRPKQIKFAKRNLYVTMTWNFPCEKVCFLFLFFFGVYIFVSIVV